MTYAFSAILSISLIALAAFCLWQKYLIRSSLYGDYPPFVRRAIPVEDRVPVLMYHAVTASRLRGDAQFLRDNGYRALTLAEFKDSLAAKPLPNSRCVLLTFDDALLNTYQVAAPILAEFGLPCVCFACPALLAEGPCRAQSPEGSDPGASDENGALMNWSEVERLHRDVLVDFQSHSVDHRLIFAGDILQGFYNGTQRSWTYGRVFPIPSDRAREQPDPSWWNAPVALGRPIYAIQSRLGPHRRFIEPTQARLACERLVAENGGPAFFRSPDAQTRLRDVYDRAVAESGGGTWESDLQQADAIRHSLVTSRRILQTRLNKTCDALCFPHNVSSILACRIAAEEGYSLCFEGGRAGPTPFVTFEDDPLRIPRVNANIGPDSLVPSLPGPNRRGFYRFAGRRFITRSRTILGI